MLQFRSQKQAMIDKGANPFVVTYGGNTWADETRYLSNLPTKKSIFFTTRPLPDEFEKKNDFPDPWFYRTGVFDGKFSSAVGQGASGVVLSGEWYGKKAAFKFVEVGNQVDQSYAIDSLKTLNEKLSEMTSISALAGSKIVSFYGHYR